MKEENYFVFFTWHLKQVVVGNVVIEQFNNIDVFTFSNVNIISLLLFLKTATKGKKN